MGEPPGWQVGLWPGGPGALRPGTAPVHPGGSPSSRRAALPPGLLSLCPWCSLPERVSGCACAGGLQPLSSPDLSATHTLRNLCARSASFPTRHGPADLLSSRHPTNPSHQVALLGRGFSQANALVQKTREPLSPLGRSSFPFTYTWTSDRPQSSDSPLRAHPVRVSA